MKKYLLLGFMVLFSSNTFAKTNWAGYNKQEIVDEIPTLFEITLNRYPELRGKLKPDFESIQLDMSIPVYLLASVNGAVAGAPNVLRYTLEMDVIDIENGDTMELVCPVSVRHESSTDFFRMYFATTFCTCTLTQDGEDKREVFINPSLNPKHEFYGRI